MLLPSVCGPCLACSGRLAVGRDGDTPWLSAPDHPSLELSTQDLGRPELCCPDLENGEIPSVDICLSLSAGLMSYQQVGHWAHHCQEGTGLRWGDPGPGASGPCGRCGSGGPSDQDLQAPQRHCQGSPGGPVETFGWRSSWEYWHHFLSFLGFPNLLGIFYWFLVLNHLLCWDSPCIGVRPRSEGKVGGIKRYARLGPEVLKRHKRQGCHWPRKQGGQQVRPKPGSERIWKGVWRGGGWWETCRAAGANQPAMTKSCKKISFGGIFVTFLHLWSSRLSDVPFPFYFASSSHPHWGKTMIKYNTNAAPNETDQEGVFLLVPPKMTKYWFSNSEKLIWDKSKLQMDFSNIFRGNHKKPCSSRW